MKKLLPLLGLALAAYFLTRKSKTYKVLEVDGPSTYVILKDGENYWQFPVPNAFIGLTLEIPPSASVSSKRDYDTLTGTEYKS